MSLKKDLILLVSNNKMYVISSISHLLEQLVLDTYAGKQLSKLPQMSK